MNKSTLCGAVRIAGLTFLLATIVQFVKQIAFPRASIWESHIVTILLLTIGMFALSLHVIAREAQLRRTIRARDDFSRTVIENLPAILCIFDRNGKFLRWNSQLETKLGYSKGQLLTMTVLDTVDEPDREGARQGIELASGSAPVNLEACLLHSDGRKSHFHLTGQNITFNGKPCILGIAVDISSQRRAQEQLRLQAAALKAAANGIVITDREGNVQWVNPAFTAMTGFEMDEIIGKNPRVLKSGKQDKEFYRDLWTTISSGSVWRGEIANRRKNGTIYSEEMTITPVASATGVITNYIGIKNDVSRRKRAEESFARAEQKYRNIFEHAIIGIFQSTPDGKFLMMNPAMARMLGCESPAQALQEIRDISLLYTDPELRQELQSKLQTDGAIQNLDQEFRRRNGTELWLSLNLRCIYNADGTAAYYEGTADDITERKLLERQLQQAQKMEAVARLAGGVAHDFNNMLGVINGYCELLQQRNDLHKTVLHQIDQIQLAGKKAASLTQQLLAFSRKQICQPRIIEVNQALTKLAGMLRRLIGEDIELVLHPSKDDAYIRVDPTQLDQVIMNLAVNSRDAMPQGGKLFIECEVCDLDVPYSMKHRPVKPGRYLRLTITDTGSGMDREAMSHLFEPFFTTKELGRGTGLGLSIVYGIVKQSEGYIWAYSEPGQGTSFKIYLPLKEAAIQEVPSAAIVEHANGSEHVLVVEDDHALRSMEVDFLRQLGYSVLQAENGEEALRLASDPASPIEILMTDIVLPKLSGRELADELLASSPHLKVLYMSGYTHDALVHTRELRKGEAFLQKPFSLSELSAKLREIAGNAAKAVAAAQGQ